MRIFLCDVIIVVVLAKPESSKVTIRLRIRIIRWRKQLRKLMPKSILEHNEGIVKNIELFASVRRLYRTGAILLLQFKGALCLAMTQEFSVTSKENNTNWLNEQ